MSVMQELSVPMPDRPAGAFNGRAWPSATDPTTASKRFWADALALYGSASPRILPNVLIFGALATLVFFADSVIRVANLAIEIGPHEVAGVLLGLLLVLRTNAGYDRWWEARKLWGGIVNQSRNLAIDALSYGPADRRWRDQIVRYTAAFAHVSRSTLRDEHEVPQLRQLLTPEQVAQVQASRHMPSHVAMVIGELLRDARDRMGMSEFGFLEVNKQRSQLIDHIGACERILRTPLAQVYAITIRRFILLFLATLPFALLHKLESGWLMPLATMMIAYAVLGLDQIGIELQNPFTPRSLGKLPLDEIASKIEGELLDLIESTPLPEADQRLPARSATGRPRGDAA